MVEELRERLKVGRVNKSSAVSEEKRGKVGGGRKRENKGVRTWEESVGPAVKMLVVIIPDTLCPCSSFKTLPA